ncbi:unnamed protein product [Trichobilharzia szidati]|nr:unnamed protein product [Trichobilharzia szidati]
MQPYPGNQSPIYGNPPYPQMSPPFQMPPQAQYQPGQQYVMTPGFQGQEFIYAPFDDDTVRNRFISKTRNFIMDYKKPYYALVSTTIAQSFLLAVISCAYSTYNVLTAVGITFMICLCATIFARTTSIDFTKCWLVLFMMLIALIFMGIASMFVYAYYGRNNVFHVIYGGFGAVVFTLYLIYDTQLLIGGRTYSLNPEEYIFGTLVLYIDIIMIFTYLMKLIGGEY